MTTNHDERLSELRKKKQQLEQEYEKLVKKDKEVEQELIKLENQFRQAKKSRMFTLFSPSQLKRFVRTVGAYALGRRNRKRLYSKEYKRKQANNDLRKYTVALYNEGFIEKALSDMVRVNEQTLNPYLRRATAWEISLWHANKQTKNGAYQALPFIQQAKDGESDPNLIRRISIIEAECLHRLNQVIQAKQVIQDQIKKETHPDLYLALANLETNAEIRLKRINQTLELYKLQPIQFCSADRKVNYDDLRTKPMDKKQDGPKISVILPAYNAEVGIQIAIESILSQTWQNIELLIVDDCSNDKTWEVIEGYAMEDARIIPLSTPVNSGPYVARNIALKRATGEFVTVHDADDWSHAEKLEIQANHLLQNPKAIGNTSEQARLTEDLQFYRRGTPGKYIFSNMSSLLFRREQVMNKIGYWDTVRFAADGEYKRRMMNEFGKEAVVDLPTGPLSFPRQTASSLTGSSAFGYNGYFMGARREYVESFSHYHKQAKTLCYPLEQKQRLFPVPMPMLPDRVKNERHIDIMMAADFYNMENSEAQLLIQEINKHKGLGLTTGLIQMSSYDLKRKKKFHPEIRKIIDGQEVQMIVYGEEIICDLLIIRSPRILMERQIYVPTVRTVAALVIIDVLPKISYNSKEELNYKIRQSLYRLMEYFDKRGRWYPLNETIRRELKKSYGHELKSIQLSRENWVTKEELPEERHAMRIKDWSIKQI